MTQTWHAPPALLAAYVEGRVDPVAGASLERHLDRCPDCRGAVRPLTDAGVLDRAWQGLSTAMDAPRLSRPIRIARRLGLAEPTAILLAAAASLRAAWLSGAVVALAFATLAAVLSQSMLWPFLLVAPLVPVVGVAVAYESADDPFEALALTAPYGRTRLVLVRTLAVLVSTLPPAVLLGLALPGPGWVAVAWLGPALAMVSVLLALASFVGPRAAAPVVALLWCAVVLASVHTVSSTWPVEETQQAGYLTLATASVAVLAARTRGTIGAVL